MLGTEEQIARELAVDSALVMLLDDTEPVYITETTPSGSDRFDALYIVTDGDTHNDPDQPFNDGTTGDFHRIVTGGTFIITFGVRYDDNLPSHGSKRKYIEQIYLRSTASLDDVAELLEGAEVAA